MNFPIHLFTTETKVLSLFSAAFYGDHDVQHLFNAKVKDVTMVDTDIEKLHVMQKQYHYKYSPNDAFNVIDLCKNVDWDIIISDQWTNQDEEIWKRYEKLKNMATKFLIISIAKGANPHIKLPPGDLMKRSDHLGGTYWHITKI